MAYFAHHDNYGNILPIEIACIYKDIFIYGLKEGETLFAHDPYLVQTRNGQIIGMNETFSRFYVVNEQNIVIQSLSLQWTETCLNPSLIQSTHDVKTWSLENLSMMIFGLLLTSVVMTTLKRLYA